MERCKHLDYEDKYEDCEIVEFAEHEFPCRVRYWRRGERWVEGGRNPRNVQFCKLRGRINEIFACYNPKEMVMCHESMDPETKLGAGGEG